MTSTVRDVHCVTVTLRKLDTPPSNWRVASASDAREMVTAVRARVWEGRTRRMSVPLTRSKVRFDTRRSRGRSGGKEMKGVDMKEKSRVRALPSMMRVVRVGQSDKFENVERNGGGEERRTATEETLASQAEAMAAERELDAISRLADTAGKSLCLTCWTALDGFMEAREWRMSPAIVECIKSSNSKDGKQQIFIVQTGNVKKNEFVSFDLDGEASVKNVTLQHGTHWP